MILRSVTKHVKDQNWVAIFLDLMIVVFGVFIGLQVSNWNDEQVDENKAKILIKRLYGDLSKDQEVVKSSLNYHAVAKSYAIVAIEGFNKINLVNDEQFVIAAYQASQYSGDWNYRSAYIELISTGKIDLVKSDTLKDLILGFYSADWVDSSFVDSSEPYRKYIRGVIPYKIQDTIRNECGDIPIPVAQTFGYRLPETCDLQLPEELFIETATNLRSQSHALKYLRYQVALSESQIQVLVDLEKEIKKLIFAIDEFNHN